MLEQPESSANSPGRPAASRSQAISPRGTCRPSTQPVAARTTGHIRRVNFSSPVTRYSCQTPAAT